MNVSSIEDITNAMSPTLFNETPVPYFQSKLVVPTSLDSSSNNCIVGVGDSHTFDKGSLLLKASKESDA